MEAFEETFVKVGNQYLNVENISQVTITEDIVHVLTSAKNECVLSRSLNADDANYESSAMKKVARKINEKAHDIVYLEAILQNKEELFEEDISSNLLYRRWLEHEHSEESAAPDSNHDHTQNNQKKRFSFRKKTT